MRYVIDRFEGELAVCEREDRAMVTLPRAELPPGCREGDALEKTEHGFACADNSDARERIREKLRRLMEK